MSDEGSDISMDDLRRTSLPTEQLAMFMGNPNPLGIPLFRQIREMGLDDERASLLGSQYQMSSTGSQYSDEIIDDVSIFQFFFSICQLRTKYC